MALIETVTYFQVLFAMRKIPDSEIWKPEPESIVSIYVDKMDWGFFSCCFADEINFRWLFLYKFTKSKPQ